MARQAGRHEGLALRRVHLVAPAGIPAAGRVEALGLRFLEARLALRIGLCRGLRERDKDEDGSCSCHARESCA